MTAKEIVEKWIGSAFPTDDPATKEIIARIIAGLISDIESAKEKRANWTTQYPTQPGYYWLRNYILSANPRMQPVSRLEVVRVTPESDGFLIFHRVSDSRQWCVGDFISAEWYGPILPPE